MLSFSFLNSICCFLGAKVTHFCLKKGDFWQVDQNFLKEKIYPLVSNTCFVHDEFFEKKNFPTKRNGLEFVGQVFDENDKTVEEHLEPLREFLEKNR